MMQSPKAGSMFASNILALGMYTFLSRLSDLMAPSHEFLLQNSPGLLYRWHCWVSLHPFCYGTVLSTACARTAAVVGCQMTMLHHEVLGDAQLECHRLSLAVLMLIFLSEPTAFAAHGHYAGLAVITSCLHELCKCNNHMWEGYVLFAY